MNPQQKLIHKNNLLRIGAAAIQHAMKSVAIGEKSEQLISQRIQSVLDGHPDIAEVKREQAEFRRMTMTHTPAIVASEKLILLADYGGYLSGEDIRNVFRLCQEFANEKTWQRKNLEPLIEKCFRNPGIPLEEIKIN
jgi:hypothetical protein